jgi:methionine synthase I (cobalamin-dependent)
VSDPSNCDPSSVACRVRSKPSDLRRPRATFLEAMKREPIVLDAALGTRLCARGLVLGEDDPCLWNLTRPATVLALHRLDITAGARAVFTNTFGASRGWLARFGRSDVRTINRRAVALARRAAGAERFILGDIGPAAALAAGAAAEQAAILREAGVDALIFETFRAEVLARILPEVNDALGGALPVIASLWEWPDPPEPTARKLIELGATALGLNCRAGMAPALAFAERMHRVVDCPLLVKPSAAMPEDGGSTPAAFAALVPELLRLGVRLLGGCCGTTHEHVAALASACTSESRTACPVLSGAAISRP